MIAINNSSTSYLKYPLLVLVTVVSAFVLRFWEAWYIIQNFAIESWIQVILFEGLGLLKDFGILFLGFTIIYLFERNFRIKNKNLGYIYLFFISLFIAAQGILLIYYFIEAVPLGATLYTYSWDEALLTIRSSGYSITKAIFLILSSFILVFVLYALINRRLKNRFKRTMFYKAFAFVCVILFVIGLSTQLKTNYSTNKSIYFYTQSIKYFLKEETFQTVAYSEKKVKEFQKEFPADYINTQYPFLKHPDTTNYIGKYFDKFDTIPNVVVLIVEGLNDDYIHQSDGITFMPFLSSLKDSSLYWERCFALGERSYAVTPSLMGGLPYGKISFAQLKSYPNFMSLVSVLKFNGYQTSFTCGNAAWFHNKDRFFNYQGAKYVYGKEKYPKSYADKKITVEDFFWGYDDKVLFTQALINKDEFPSKPYFDVYYTGTMHSPFVIRDSSEYEKRYKALINQATSKKKANILKKYEKYYITTLFADDALKDFFKSYSKRPEYQNTIFVITGDHPMTESPIKNSLKRYHVPFIIYSPKLKRPAKSKNVVSQLDFYQTLLNLLREYGVKAPKFSSSLGSTLKIIGNDKDRTFVFMDTDRRIRDMYDNGYFITYNTVYKVQDDWSIEKIKDKNKTDYLKQKLNSFNYVNLLSTLSNRLYPTEDYLTFFNKKEIHDTSSYKQIISKETYIPLASKQINSTNKDIKVKLTVRYKHSADDVSVAVQLVDKTGETSYWKNEGLPNESNVVGVEYKIPSEKIKPDSKIKVYIWNEEKKKILVHSFEVMIYEDK